jgi:hypothetical protein
MTEQLTETEPGEGENPSSEAVSADLGDSATEPEESDEQATEPAESENPSREAAKYRRRLRESESEQETLRNQLDAAQRGLIDRLAMDNRIRPAALWTMGHQPADFVGEDGAVDPAKVAEASEQAARELGLARRPKPNAAQDGNDAPPKAAFTEAFKPR